MHCHCSQSHTFSHALPLLSISTTSGRHQFPWIRAACTTTNTINRLLDYFKLAYSFNNVWMSSKAQHESHFLPLLPLSAPLRIPLNFGWQAHHICKSSYIPSFPSNLWRPSKSPFDNDHTAHTPGQIPITHCSKQYLSIGRKIRNLFSTLHP